MTKASFILAVQTKQKPTVQLAICYDSSAIWAPTHLEVRKETWMTDMIIAWMSRWNLGSMVRINGLFHLLINGVYWGYNPRILTFDPNFLGHPSRSFLTTSVLRLTQLTPGLLIKNRSLPYPQQSGYSWMYPYQRTPMGNPYISPIYPYIVGVYGLLSPRIPI